MRQQAQTTQRESIQPAHPEYSVNEAAQLLGLSRWTVTRLFEHEPGVRIFGNEKSTRNRRRNGRYGYRSMCCAGCKSDTPFGSKYETGIPRGFGESGERSYLFSFLNVPITSVSNLSCRDCTHLQ